MAAQSQNLSPSTLILVVFGPGLLAFFVVQTMFGYWPSVAAFVVLEAGVLLLIRQDYRRGWLRRGLPAAPERPHVGCNCIKQRRSGETMLENAARPTQPPPPADHRHIQQSDLPAEQIYTREPAPKGRLAGCVLAVLLSGWALIVPIALIDRLKDASESAVGVITGIIVVSAVITATLGCIRLSAARDKRKSLSFTLIATLTTAIAVSVISATRLEYGLLLLAPALLAGLPALGALARDARTN
ncbi:hypothetical protein [Pseudarthrobacter sp. NS4]|uniref:hypothetical protein n=1 Tax=Pseudarthrobacter sp. NS4 TaxID=2973976 RepID=UPI002162293A|nr:hypothetical protein [Pseudarthrobacter sp. NS4]